MRRIMLHAIDEADLKCIIVDLLLVISPCNASIYIVDFLLLSYGPWSGRYASYWNVFLLSLKEIKKLNNVFSVSLKKGLLWISC